ncbi:MAG: TonB-dependent receptor, partial [Geobacteraceae bacterium]|nr:TonB-dependent receptor [Geobacteraceae bacterium]
DNHSLLMNGTWQRSYMTNENYSDLDVEDIDEIVVYQGQQKFLSDIPRSDYNREWSANLVYHVTLGYGFAFTNITEYRSGYTAILDTKENFTSEEGERFDIYADVSLPSATTFDWKLTWEYELAAAGTLMLSAEVYNVFNRKLYTGIDAEYEMGRQLWVGMDFTF